MNPMNRRMKRQSMPELITTQFFNLLTKLRLKIAKPILLKIAL